MKNQNFFVLFRISKSSYKLVKHYQCFRKVGNFFIAFDKEYKRRLDLCGKETVGEAEADSTIKMEVTDDEDSVPTSDNVISKSPTLRTREADEEFTFPIGMDDYFDDVAVKTEEDVLSDDEDTQVSKYTFCVNCNFCLYLLLLLHNIFVNGAVTFVSLSLFSKYICYM